MPRPIHFEIHASDPERAIRFYTTVFGWTFTPWGPPGMYWTVSTGAEGPGIDGGLVPRRGPDPAEDAPVNGYALTIGVEDVDRALATALANGGRVALPKMAIPGVGWLVYIKDSESNILGMMHNDPAAA